MCPAFNFEKTNWYLYSLNTFQKSPLIMVMQSEKSAVRKTTHMSHIKKKIQTISLSIGISISMRKEKK